MRKYGADFFSVIGIFCGFRFQKGQKCSFFIKNALKIWSIQKKAVPLHSLLKRTPFFDKANSRQLVAYTVAVAQLVRASDCGSEGCGIVPHLPPR